MPDMSAVGLLENDAAYVTRVHRVYRPAGPRESSSVLRLI
jgi:hypothetical protein